MVTLVRWVVEAVNGRLKNKFKFFDNVIPHHYYVSQCNSRLYRHLRIACAIMNKYLPPIFDDKPYHTDLFEQIQLRENVPNSLGEEINAQPKDFVTKRLCWEKYSATDLQDFPVLSMDELRKICLGQFNLKNAPGYADEYMRLDEQFHIQLHKERPGLLRLRLKSKYRSATEHYVWIDYSTQGNEKIRRWYCQCMAGARTMGCCSHVAMVLWFFGFKRHQGASTTKIYGEEILEIVKKQVRDIEEFGESDTDDASEGE